MQHVVALCLRVHTQPGCFILTPPPPILPAFLANFAAAGKPAASAAAAPTPGGGTAGAGDASSAVSPASTTSTPGSSKGALVVLAFFCLSPLQFLNTYKERACCAQDLWCILCVSMYVFMCEFMFFCANVLCATPHRREGASGQHAYVCVHHHGCVHGDAAEEGGWLQRRWPPQLEGVCVSHGLYPRSLSCIGLCTMNPTGAQGVS